MLEGRPHHARAKPWVLELVDERSQGVLRREQRAQEGRLERQALDALGAPLGFQLRARDAPDFFCVRLEEDMEQATSKTVGDPLLEGVFGSKRQDLPFQV